VPADPIDRIIEAWAKSDPEVDPTPLEVAGRILLCAARLERRIASALEPLGLSFADFDVINTLRRRADPGGTNPKELARASLITSGAMTSRLDRLERARLVRRASDPNDRRGVLIHLTPEGERLARRALQAVIEADKEFLGPLTARQWADLVGGLRVLLLRSDPS
jgi:DNA-binding MarR family transcriptional regulator